jgi:hypothetical protein
VSVWEDEQPFCELQWQFVKKVLEKLAVNMGWGNGMDEGERVAQRLQEWR